jgi:hypothetical protein
VSDALDCLVRKLGIADSEITTDARVAGSTSTTATAPSSSRRLRRRHRGVPQRDHACGGNVDKLSSYDVVLFSCEGGQYPGTESQDAMNAVHEYAGKGGRISCRTTMPPHPAGEGARVHLF